MLDMSRYLIDKTIEDIRQDANKNRRKEVNKFLDFYSGDNTRQYIKDKFKASAFQEIEPVCFNITRRFIDRMSRIYTQDASRNVSDTYKNVYAHKKDTAMKHIEKMTRLLGTVAVQVTYMPESKCFHYNPILNFDVHLSEDDPYTPLAIIYPLALPTSGLYNSKSIKYAYWDSEHYIVYDNDGKVVEQYAHGVGRLPFVFFHREHQLDSFYTAGAYDIINCNEAIDIILTEAALGMRFQMFGQYSITGLYSDEKVQRAGSDEILILPEGAEFDIKSPKANVQDAVELVKAMIDLVAQNNHLYVSFAQDGGEVPSGIALKIKDLERFEDFQDDLSLWNSYEHDLYSLERDVALLYVLSLPNNFKVDFTEPEYPMTAQDEIAKAQFALEHNLTTPAQLLQKHNKDLTIEEAQKIIDENKEVNGNKETEKQGGSIFSRLLAGAQKPEQQDRPEDTE